MNISKTEIRKPNIYLAAPFFSPEQIERVERVEQALENNPFVQAYFSPMREQLPHLAVGSKLWSQAVYNNDVHHIDWADVVVAVVDYEGGTVLHGERHGHVDSGTAFEIGYAVAKGKPVILIHELGGIVNLMLSESCRAYITHPEAIEDYNFLAMPAIAYKGGVV